MSKFLDDQELGKAIREVVKGGRLRCAVAFWGTGAAEALFHDAGVLGDARLICDISMGGTNPRELEALGAPRNSNLLHLCGLHAKVYISDRGLITASANASNNGIGFIDVAGLVEAGTFHGVDSDAYERAGAWFEKIWDRASAMGPDALAEAKKAWCRKRVGARSRMGRPVDPKSLLDRVIADPGAFRGIGFVFTSGTSTAAHRHEAAKAICARDDRLSFPLLSKQARRALTSWPIGNVFSDWPEDDVSAWPERFVCAHRGSRGGIGYWFYERSHSVILDDDRGMVFANQVRGLRRHLGFPHGRAVMANTDGDHLRSIFDYIEQGGHQLFENGEKLAEFLTELELV